MVSFDARLPGTSVADWVADARLHTLPAFTLDGFAHLIVLAAHPDDETLGAGGLLAEAFARGIPSTVVIVTDGSASHPRSPTVSPEALARLRAAEVRAAVALLSPAAEVALLDFADGSLDRQLPAIRAALAAHPALATPTGPTLLAAPWRGDGHRDHRLLGELAAELARERGLTLVEYPIWLWHWANPGHPDTPWTGLVALPLGDSVRAAKQNAIREHRSQVERLSPADGDEEQLLAEFLRHFDRGDEIFVRSEHPEQEPGVAHPPTRTALPGTYFDDTYARRADPWGFTTRWYERRKRAVTLAALPRERYANALEIGCSIGVLTHDLAARTDALLAIDIAEAAVERARERLAGEPHVTVELGDAATAFPAGRFDLIVLSEVGYYFDAPTLAAVAADIFAALTPDATFVACHWRHPVTDYLQTGDHVHTVIAAQAARASCTRLAHHIEADFVLDVYSPNPRSVAAETGLA
ncbi:PIG-L family deacetylase [Subtercola vilae]|uniref:Methyltransferase domain-containing protein n=1 Tax=Subtercola vilae TaxID=2056433 RepID=A0A4V4RI36_9MICO|nr:PIG-L family deacetylase [Subtercola vilae]TIH40594.1 methyltransferase domain-containing protein [Subtercola vilae]